MKHFRTCFHGRSAPPVELGSSFWGKGFGLERRDGGVYPFRDGFLGGLRQVGLNVDVPPVPSSLPIMGHRWSASTSFVLAALRALHVDSSSAVTGSAMIEKGTSTPRPYRRVTRTGGLSRFGSYETNRNREDQSPCVPQ